MRAIAKIKPIMEDPAILKPPTSKTEMTEEDREEEEEEAGLPVTLAAELTIPTDSFVK
jgi:hypothetical protein